jgi:hypothetical protein
MKEELQNCREMGKRARSTLAFSRRLKGGGILLPNL